MLRRFSPPAGQGAAEQRHPGEDTLQSSGQDKLSLQHITNVVKALEMAKRDQASSLKATGISIGRAQR